MGKWIKGDLHVHTHNCNDGTLSVDEILKRCCKYVDFIGISGHAYNTPDCLEAQYNEILKAREDYPHMPIFHTAEQNFPIERHVMYITSPDNNEFMLQRELIHNFNRWDGHVGLEEALRELDYVLEKWGEEKVFMIFNHPNDPDVTYENFEALAQRNGIFKVIACVDRRERRAKQTWEIGEEWDRLLCKGYKLSARNGSDFHKHFFEGGEDYLPGEFVQDYLFVEENTYDEIIKAYRNGNYYCCVGDCIHEPVFKCEKNKDGLYDVELSFTSTVDMVEVDIISDGKCVLSLTDIPKDFSYKGTLEGKGYFRVRGWGKGVDRKYSKGQYEPQFILKPVYTEEE